MFICLDEIFLLNVYHLAYKYSKSSSTTRATSMLSRQHNDRTAWPSAPCCHSPDVDKVATEQQFGHIDEVVHLALVQENLAALV